MTADEVLAQARGLASVNRLRYSGHGIDEAIEASADDADVRHALVHARSCRPGRVKGRWVITGPDWDGDDLDVVIVFEDEIVVITVI